MLNTVFLCCCSVAKSCLTLCNPMDCSTPGFRVLPYLLEFAQIMSIDPVISSNHLILCCSLLLLASILPSISVFSKESALHIRWPKLQLQHQSFQRIFRVDFLSDSLVWSPCNQRYSQESSPAPQFESINSSVFSRLYGPTLTSVPDYWKDHSFDYTDLHEQQQGFLCAGSTS